MPLSSSQRSTVEVAGGCLVERSDEACTAVIVFPRQNSVNKPCAHDLPVPTSPGLTQGTPSHKTIAFSALLELGSRVRD